MSNNKRQRIDYGNHRSVQKKGAYAGHSLDLVRMHNDKPMSGETLSRRLDCQLRERLVMACLGSITLSFHRRSSQLYLSPTTRPYGRTAGESSQVVETVPTPSGAKSCRTSHWPARSAMQKGYFTTCMRWSAALARVGTRSRCLPFDRRERRDCRDTASYRSGRSS